MRRYKVVINKQRGGDQDYEIQAESEPEARRKALAQYRNMHNGAGSIRWVEDLGLVSDK